MLTFGKKLSTVRALLGLTQQQLAETLNVNRQYLILLESDGALPTPERQADLEKVLGISLDDPELTRQLERVIKLHQQATGEKKVNLALVA